MTPDARLLLASFGIPFSNKIVCNNIVGKWRMSSGKRLLPKKNSETAARREKDAPDQWP